MEHIKKSKNRLRFDHSLKSDQLTYGGWYISLEVLFQTETGKLFVVVVQLLTGSNFLLN